MSVIANHLGMLVAMWIVLVAVGLQVLVTLIQGLRGKANFGNMASAVLGPMVSDILPLIILALLTTIDGTGILIRIWYYVGCVLVILRALMHLGQFARR